MGEKSNLQFLLRTTEDGAFESHFYLNSWTISATCFILISDKRIFSFSLTKGSTPKLNWAFPFLEIRDINMVDHGVNILLRNGKSVTFECHQKTAEKIKNAVWKLMNRRKTPAFKQLEYHLVEDKAIVQREVDETRKYPAAPGSPVVPHRTPLRGDQQFDSFASISSVATEATTTPVSEKTPLINKQNLEGQASGQRGVPGQAQRRPPPRKRQEDECCSCTLL